MTLLLAVRDDQAGQTIVCADRGQWVSDLALHVPDHSSKLTCVLGWTMGLTGTAGVAHVAQELFAERFRRPGEVTERDVYAFADRLAELVSERVVRFRTIVADARPDLGYMFLVSNKLRTWRGSPDGSATEVAEPVLGFGADQAIGAALGSLMLGRTAIDSAYLACRVAARVSDCALPPFDFTRDGIVIGRWAGTDELR